MVSIITPSFNRYKYFEECIQSVLNQNYPYIEHIIVDGGSTDGTLEILKRYADNYPDRIKYISEPDKGAGEANNKGLKITKGEIFGFLCSDDTYEPDTIQRVVKFFEFNPGAYFVHGGCNFTDAKGTILYTHKPKDFALNELINDNNPVALPSSFYKRKVIEKVGLWDTYGNDLDYIIRIMKMFKIYRIEKTLSNFRIHNESETGSKINRIRVLWMDYQVSRRYGGLFFSGYHKRYYKFLTIELLRPI